jgi:cell fate regulator YaaT (PSP1 superfamily)
VPTVVGVKLRFAPKVLHFDPAGVELTEGDFAIVETERGTEIGEVLEAAYEVDAADLAAPLKPVVRKASEEDIDRMRELEREECRCSAN